MQYEERWWRFGLVLAITALAAGPACSQPMKDPVPMPRDISSHPTRVPGEYLVTLTAGSDVKVIANVYGRFGIKATQDLGRNLYRVVLTEDPGPAKMEELRGQIPQIRNVQPNFVYQGQRATEH